jgi:hypothetical protein
VGENFFVAGIIGNRTRWPRKDKIWERLVIKSNAQKDINPKKNLAKDYAGGGSTAGTTDAHVIGLGNRDEQYGGVATEQKPGMTITKKFREEAT